eukprot:scaffold1869_cov122-Cylindrotheca_fusiformis.AAC.35
MRCETIDQTYRGNRRRNDIYEAYESSDFQPRRGKKHTDQVAVVSMLDSFTHLCVGDYPTSAQNVHGVHEKRKYKYVLYPVPRYPNDRPRLQQSEQRRKRIKQHIFRPVSEDEKPVSQHRRGYR